MENLKLIKKYQKEITLLSQTNALLSWDRQTYMPKGAFESRSEQEALLSRLAHEKLTCDELSTALENLDNSKLGELDRIMVKRLSRDIEMAKKLPASFVEELSRASALGYSVWEKAKKNNDFPGFEPYLKKIVELKRKEAGYIGLPGHPYNSLLDKFEEGMTIEKLEPIFEKLKKDLIKLLGKIKKSEKYKEEKKSLIKNREFSKEKQIDLAKDVVKRMGLDNNFFRMDQTEHPFEERTGNKDIRIAISFKKSPLFSFSSATHEGGHALYDSGYPKEFEYTVLDNAPSIGLHESQSRFWEKIIGSSKTFWGFYFEKFNKAFDIDKESEKWYEEANEISPSLIRFEADEIHYCLHIILRTEIEKGLIDGSIEVEDLPKIWNRSILGLFRKMTRKGFYKMFIGLWDFSDISQLMQSELFIRHNYFIV